VNEAALPPIAAAPAPAHDPRRVALGVLLAFTVAFTLTVALGFLLEIGWSSDGSTGLDAEVTRWMVDRRSQPWTDVMRFVTWLGSSWVVFPLAVVAVVVLLIVRQRWLALFVALSVIGASVLSVLAKDVIERDRPPLDIRLQHSVSYSFPSGHSTQAAATYFAFAIAVTVLSESRALRTIAWLVAALIVFSVGVSRIYLGMHWVTDVLGGWMLGSLCAAGLAVALAPLKTGQHAAPPPPRPGEADRRKH
jgi:membrane-associated phospholipid phosphatase